MTATEPTSQFPVPIPERDVAVERERLLARADAVTGNGPFAPTWESLAAYQVPEWFRDAKFGVFIHWLVASVPAFGTDWYPRTMYLESTPEFAHHREVYGYQAEHGFKDFIPDFTGAEFDADDWLGLIARTGARYVVPVAEHHDGFILGHTDLSRWSATRVGPHRDVLAELKAAAEAHGVRFGLSSHRAENWWFFQGGTRFASDVRDPQWADLYGPAELKSTQPDEDFLQDWLARTVDLVERYDPELVWFDWWIEEPAFEPYRRRFAAYYYDHADADGRGVVLNYKWDAFVEGTAVYDIERGVARGISPLPFQIDTSTSRVGWAHLTENEYKPADEILVELVDAVSKNGALLLNIGPGPDGRIDSRERALLDDIGAWMAVNGEAIHDTRPWRVEGEGPTVAAAGSFVDAAPTAWTAEDVRFTTRGDTLYATVLNLPRMGGEVTVRSLASSLRLFEGDVTAVRLLGVDADLEFRRDAGGLVVSVPERASSSTLAVLRVELVPAGPPERQEPPIAD